MSVLPRVVGAILDEATRDADRYLAKVIETVVVVVPLRPRLGLVCNYVKKSRIRDNYIIDYVTRLSYIPNIPLMRGAF